MEKNDFDESTCSGSIDSDSLDGNNVIISLIMFGKDKIKQYGT